MSNQGIIGGSGCTPLPLPVANLIVNPTDTCGSYNTLKDALADVTADGTVIYVLADTVEPDVNTTVTFDVDIVIKPDVTITHTGFETLLITDNNKTVNIWGGTVLGSGDAIGTYETFSGTLNMYNHSSFVGSGGGHTLYPTFGNIYAENCTFTNTGNDVMRVVNAMTSITIYKSKLECISENTSHDGIDDNNGGAAILYDIQDSQILASGGSAMTFSTAPLNGVSATTSSRFFRNTLQAGAGAGVFTVASVAWNPAYFSMNTLYKGAGGAFSALITVFAGLTNDII